MIELPKTISRADSEIVWPTRYSCNGSCQRRARMRPTDELMDSDKQLASFADMFRVGDTEESDEDAISGHSCNAALIVSDSQILDWVSN